MLMRFDDDGFTPSLGITVGIDFRIRTVGIDGNGVRMQIWDTAGQERFRTHTTAYYRGAMGILLCYDICDEISFFQIREWIRSVQLHASEYIQLILVGCKCDMEDDREVTRERGQALADEFDMPFIETSAKTNVNVDEAFMTLAQDILEKRKKIMSEEMETAIGVQPMSARHGRRCII